MNNLNTETNTSVITEKINLSKRRGEPLFWVFVILTVIFAGATAFFWKENYDLKKNPDKFAEDEKEALISKVGKLMILPKGEDPTIATVTDLSVLKDQPFFDSAQVGDKVLIYSVAKKAILFNPTENKVVEVAPINEPPINEERKEQTSEGANEGI